MLKSIKDKLKSKTGASISIALLLFLVCAVIGSLVITAGTVASGRLSKKSDSDQRYYSVISAARVLAKELSNKEVIITRTIEKETETTDYYVLGEDEDGKPVVNYAGTDITKKNIYSTDINNNTDKPMDIVVTASGGTEPTSDIGRNIGTTGRSLLTSLAIVSMFGNNDCNTDEAFEYSLNDENSVDETVIKLSHLTNSDTDINNSDLSIKGTYKMLDDGSIIIKVTNDSENDNYIVVIKLIPVDNEEYTTDNIDGGTSYSYSDAGYSVTTTKTIVHIKTSKIHWEIDSITKEVN